MCQGWGREGVGEVIVEGLVLILKTVWVQMLGQVYRAMSLY